MGFITIRSDNNRSDNSSDNYTVQLIEVVHELLIINSDLCKRSSVDSITRTDSNLY